MKLLLIFICCLLAGCAASEPVETTVSTASVTIPETTAVTIPETTVPPITEAPDPIRKMISDMSLQERVGQLFLARCDDNIALQDITDYHLGGFVLFGRDFEGQTPDTLKEKLAAYQATAKLPLLIAVDEEGGTVTRVSSYSAFRSAKFPSPQSLFESGGLEAVLLCEKEKCLLLSSLGINVNLAPVCDITTDPDAFLYSRSLGQSPETTAAFVSGAVKEMASNRIGSCLKHFPGYGNNADTHVGIVTDGRSLETLESWDLIPFAAGMEAGADAILVSHNIAEALDPEMPASLSPAVHHYLRSNMGFEGVIVTDDLVMQAITDAYGAGEAAVLAVLAGNDLLCSTDYRTQYDAVYQAVLDGRIDIDILNSAVRNVLEWKMELGLI